jgi:crotonobetainyl-CoA:carnitine CoA-transferase CaiB-like acyl-CoA transferase
MEQALSGVKVLEYCNFVSGPYCSKLIADLGAEVIKIEEPSTGDEARRRSPFPDDMPNPERSGLFLYLNSNKLGITLNLASTAGKKVFKELVKNADILVEDTSPGTMDDLGLGYDILKEVNPSLIMTSITPYGQTGPYSKYKAHHLNIYHSSGQAQFSYTMSHESGLPPVKGGGFLGDYDAGLSGAVATLAALFKRILGGTGQHIDISRQEALISLDRIDIGSFTNDESMLERRRGMLGGLMPCKDGYVVVLAPQQHQWEAMMKMMGNPEWSEGEKCKDEFTRSEHAGELQPLINEWMLQHTKDEIYHLGQSYGCPSAPVNSTADVFNSPQMKERGFFVDITHSQVGKLSYPSASYKLSETPWQVNCAAPLLGEHNQQIYCGRLDFTKEELAEMKVSGVI